MYNDETESEKDTREFRNHKTKMDILLSNHDSSAVGEEGDIGNGYVIRSATYGDTPYKSLDAVSTRHILESSGYMIEKESRSGEDTSYLGLLISPRKTITVDSAGVIPKEMAEAVHKMMQERGLLPETDLDYISLKDSLDTISALGLAMDTEGNLYSKYNLPDNFHTSCDLTFENTLGIKNLPKGLTVDGTLTLAEDTVSLESDSKVKTLILAESGNLARLPNVAEVIVSDTKFDVTRIHNIDPKIALDKFMIKEGAVGGNLTAEDILPAQENWTNDLKSAKLPFRTKFAMMAKYGR